MRVWEKLFVAVGLMGIGALAGVIVVMMLDPDCGPDGDSQKACAAEIADDVLGGR